MPPLNIHIYVCSTWFTKLPLDHNYIFADYDDVYPHI